MPKIESYTKSTVYDQSQVTVLPPLDSGYNIIGAIFTPNGPIEKMKITSATEFAKYYLNGTTVNPEDNITCQYLYELLKTNPVYVMRAVPVILLEGITSTGRSLLFDQNYNMLDEYYKFWIKGLEYKDKSCSIKIYKGENLDYEATQEPTADDSVNIDELLMNLPTEYNEDVLVSVPGKLVLFNKTAEKSDTIGLFDVTTEYQKYTIIDSSNPITENLNQNGTMNKDSFITCNGVDYVFNVTDSSGYTNIHNIYDPLNRDTMDPNYFLMQVIALTNARTSGELEFSLIDSTQDQNTTSLDYSNIRSIIADEGNFKICINDVISDGYIKLSYNGQTNIYYVGKNKPEEDNIDNYFRISSGQVNTYNFVVKVIESIFKNNISSFQNSNCFNFEKNDIKVYMDYNTVNSDIFNFEDNKETDFVTTYTISTNDNNDKYIKFNDFHVRVGDYVYYVGNEPDSAYTFPVNSVFIRLSISEVNFNEFYNLLVESLINTQSIIGISNSLVSKINLTLSKGSNDNNIEVVLLAEGTEDSDSSDTEYNMIKVEQSTSNDQFAVVQKFPVSGDYFQYKYAKNTDDSRLLDFSWNYKDGAEVGSTQISFYSGVTNSYGLDAFYTKVDNAFIQIVNLKEDGEIGNVEDIFESKKFGSNVIVPSFSVGYLSDTIKTITDYDDGIKYDCITDMGVVNPGYAKTIESVAKELYSIYPASLPATKDDNTLKEYVNSCGFSSYEVILLAPADRVPISEYSVLLPSSIKDIQSMVAMYNNTANEFAPRFGEEQGAVSSNNLLKKYKVTSRNDLLKSNIRTLAASINGTGYYINDNLTCNMVESYMSEEQIVRSVNKAVHLMELFIRQYTAKYNTKATRDDVQEKANMILTNALFKGKNFTPVIYRAVCNELNNPTSVIDNNQLVVSLYASFTRAIKYKLLDHYIIPLSQVSQVG